MTYLSDFFKLHNSIDFEIQNLCLDLKRKEITKYNPLHYVLGFTLEYKPWLPYGGKYEHSDCNS